MLKPPNLAESAIADSLKQDFGVDDAEVTFLPLGVDPNAAAYRVTTQSDNRVLFLKLSSSAIGETAVMLTAFLSQEGVANILAPRTTLSGQLWGKLHEYRTMLFPFVAGRDGYSVALADHHWVELGRALRQIHDSHFPDELIGRLETDTFASDCRDSVRRYMTSTIDQTFADPISAETVAFLRERREEVLTLVDRSEALAAKLAAGQPALVVCHSDIHAGNVLIGDDGRLYIVDWDDAILAPRECDLMYAGGALGFRGHTPAQEEALLLQGYNADRDPYDVNAAAVAYYRCERIVKDIDAYCDEILMFDTGDEDRAQGLRYLKSNFEPGGTIEAATRPPTLTTWRST